MVRLVLLAIIALFGILQSLTSAPAQTYPARTVRFIVPFGAASGTDITARLFADRLAARWGKPVLVENRPGGDGLVAVAAFTAANDAPFPKWQLTILNAEGSRRKMAAARREAYWWLMPWNPYRRIPFSYHSNGPG